MLGVFLPLYILVLSIYSFYLKYFHLFYILIGWGIPQFFCLPFFRLLPIKILFVPQMSPLPRILPWFSWLALVTPGLHGSFYESAQVLRVCSSIPPGSGHLLWTRSIPCLCVSSMKRPGTLWEIIQKDFISSNRIISRGFLFLPILLWFANA